MLNKLKSIFTTKNKDSIPQLNVAQATAVLMVEVIIADQHLDKDEEHLLRQIIITSFELSENEADEFIDLAKSKASESLDLYQFTSIIRAQYSTKQKQELIENLWRLAYADNHLDKYEDFIIRKVCDLIYIPQQAFIMSKQKVLAEQRNN